MQIKEKTRTQGYPTSMNGSSSFHVVWDMPDKKFIETSAILRVERAPVVDDKYFWALQMNFYGDEGELISGAHTGLMHYGMYYKTRIGAVNWGGYNLQEQNNKLNENKDETEAEDWYSAELNGTVSELPLCPDYDSNTYLFNWREGVDYRLRVYPSPGYSGFWLAEITDLEMQETTIIRDLEAGGLYIGKMVVWSEVSAKCDAPPASVVWSNFEAIDTEGNLVVPESAWMNYATYEQGGCTNTNSELTDEGIRQTTNTKRINSQKSTLVLP